MNAKDAIKIALDSNNNVMGMYLSDLSDADLLVRPVPGANHIAWQLGHLIEGECMMQGMIAADKAYALPAGFKEKHDRKTTTLDTASSFHTKAEYLDLFAKVREATLALLASQSESDLDKATTGPMAPFAPNLGAVFLLAASHQMMHAAQFTVVRRKLGKPVLF